MKKLFIAFLVIGSLSGAKAQDYFWSLTYDMTMPVGETSDFISSYQWRGIGIDNRWVYNESYSFGFYMGWHTMYEKRENEIYTSSTGNTQIQSTQFRYINSLPFVLNTHYYFNPYDKISLYAGIAAGAYWLEGRTEVGLIAIVDKGWRFGGYPEAGVHVRLDRDKRLTLACKYHYVLGRDGGPDYTYLNFNVGLAWGFF